MKSYKEFMESKIKTYPYQYNNFVFDSKEIRDLALYFIKKKSIYSGFDWAEIDKIETKKETGKMFVSFVFPRNLGGPESFELTLRSGDKIGSHKKIDTKDVPSGTKTHKPYILNP